MPEIRIPGQMYPSGHTNDGVDAVMALLQDWFEAMEDGTTVLRFPDHSYRRPRDRSTWSEEELDALVKNLDAEIDQEVTRAPGTSTGSKAGPGFQRLGVPQRLAMAQQLEALIVKYESVFPVVIQASLIAV